MAPSHRTGLLNYRLEVEEEEKPIATVGRMVVSAMRSDNVKGHRPGNDPPPSKPERIGRVCREPGCDTRLSIYNKSGMCWQHQPLIFPNYRGKRLASS